MLARKPLPPEYARWNGEHHAPFGRRGSERMRALLGGRRIAPVIRLFGPYAWQPNNTIRKFEYPWVFEQLSRPGRPLKVLDVGAGMAGMQFTLAAAGHDVHAVDPGMAARGKGWEVDPDFHAYLGRTFRGPVTLWPATISQAGFADASFDAILSISTIEHFAPADLAEFAREARRILRPGGLLVLTIDLFVDVEPFTSREANRYGVNIDVRELLEACDAELVEGRPEELHGFEEFDPERIQSDLGEYMLGAGYPALAQCVVARRR